MTRKKTAGRELFPVEVIERRILLFRGHKVMLDSHLAQLYAVETRALVQAVKRNLFRFPPDFMFQLKSVETRCLTSQFVISNPGRGGRRTLPYVFTEQGVAMLSTVLHSERAIAVNIAIMRTFVRLRQILTTHKQLAERLATMEKKYDGQFTEVFDAIRRLMAPPPPPQKRPIGFLPAPESRKESAR